MQTYTAEVRVRLAFGACSAVGKGGREGAHVGQVVMAAFYCSCGYLFQYSPNCSGGKE